MLYPSLKTLTLTLSLTHSGLIVVRLNKKVAVFTIDNNNPVIELEPFQSILKWKRAIIWPNCKNIDKNSIFIFDESEF